MRTAPHHRSRRPCTRPGTVQRCAGYPRQAGPSVERPSPDPRHRSLWRPVRGRATDRHPISHSGIVRDSVGLATLNLVIEFEDRESTKLVGQAAKPSRWRPTGLLETRAGVRDRPAPPRPGQARPGHEPAGSEGTRSRAPPRDPDGEAAPPPSVWAHAGGHHDAIGGDRAVDHCPAVDKWHPGTHTSGHRSQEGVPEGAAHLVVEFSADARHLELGCGRSGARPGCAVRSRRPDPPLTGTLTSADVCARRWRMTAVRKGLRRSRSWHQS